MLNAICFDLTGRSIFEEYIIKEFYNCFLVLLISFQFEFYYSCFEQTSNVLYNHYTPIRLFALVIAFHSTSIISSNYIGFIALQ